MCLLDEHTHTEIQAMTNIEILDRLTRYTLDALEAAQAAHDYQPTGATRYAVSRATAAHEATKLEARWAKGEIVLSDCMDDDLEDLVEVA
jgi:hypothetical protein